MDFSERFNINSRGGKMINAAFKVLGKGENDQIQTKISTSDNNTVERASASSKDIQQTVLTKFSDNAECQKPCSSSCTINEHSAHFPHVSTSELLNNDLYLSSEVDDSDHDPTYQNITETSSSDDVSVTLIETKRKVHTKTQIPKEGKKRMRNTEQWLSNKRRTLYAAGKEHVNKKGKTIPARSLKPPCSCKLNCIERINLAASDAVTAENVRATIFNEYWDENKDNNVKRQFISSCVEMKAIVRARPRDGTKPKRNTLTYNFIISNKKIKVCKVMFLNTLSISNKVVTNALKKRRKGGIIEPDLRGKHCPINKTPQDVVESVYKHIASFPSYDSHYSRERSKKQFLEPGLSIEAMHKLYTDWCTENNIEQKKIAKKWLYANIFNTKFNLSFKPPGTDTCDTCNAYMAQLKNVDSAEEREKINDDYDIHLQEAQERYSMKRSDTAFAKANNYCKVVIADLQKCLPTPHLMNCVSFYKRKLWTFNFTIYDASDSSAACIMWDESKAGRGGNEIASSLLKWADQTIPNTTVSEITLWTDNCYGQNKNMAIVMCLFWILNKYKQIKLINQKFLLKGHTHMEADTVHAVIEKKRKRSKELTILTPWDWQQLIRQCSSKYRVFNMELEDFKNFKSLYDKPTTSPFVYKKIDVDKNPLQLSQCCQLQVRQDKIGSLFVKHRFQDEAFREVNLSRLTRKKNIEIPGYLPLISDTTKMKYNDIISLLKFLPSECHTFYKNLRHEKNARDYPEDDDDE